MINIESKTLVEEFLSEYPAPTIRVATTLRDGGVVCIKPVPTICGPELMCSPSTRPDLMVLLQSLSTQE